MFRFVTVFALVSCTFAGTFPINFDGRIVNGTDTTIQLHPYQVSYQRSNGSQYCGGAIINHDTIVIAAHCLLSSSPLKFKIRLGSTEYNNGGELVEIRAFRIHEKYNGTTHLNDIGIIKLARSVNESNTVRYIELATQTPQAGTPAVVTGWGTKCIKSCDTFSIILQEVEVDIVDPKKCASINGPVILPSMICAFAKYKGPCFGDSGGPLVAASKLVGVVSWGFTCGTDRWPSMYVDVAYVHKWILDTANSL